MCGQRCVKNTLEREMVGFVGGLDVGIKGRENQGKGRIKADSQVRAQAMGGQQCHFMRWRSVGAQNHMSACTFLILGTYYRDRLSCH